MDYRQQISNALDKDVENIAFLAYFPESKLDKKLLALKQQQEIAQKNNIPDALELLQIWQQQVQDAKSLKAQLHIDDNPKLSLELSLPEIEAYEAIQKRQELLKKKLLKESKTSVGERFRSNH
jgi:hypothetical protein